MLYIFLQSISNLVALVRIWPVWQSRTSQSRRMPFFPDAPTQVSTSTISPLQQKGNNTILVSKERKSKKRRSSDVTQKRRGKNEKPTLAKYVMIIKHDQEKKIPMVHLLYFLHWRLELTHTHSHVHCPYHLTYCIWGRIILFIFFYKQVFIKKNLT